MLVTGLLSALALSPTLAAADINLTQDATIRNTASYTYYARGSADNVSNPVPFTVRFYPGGPLHGGNQDGALTDPGNGGASAVPFALGELTDGAISSNQVSGWVDIEDAHGAQTANPHVGTFDILIDLGAAYRISSVNINYTDSPGCRWVTSGTYANQSVSTALTLASGTATDSDFTLFDEEFFTKDDVRVTKPFTDGTPRAARYILLRLNVTVSPTTGSSVGGYLNEIQIMGSPRQLEVPMRADDFVETIGINTHFKGSEVIWNNNLSSIYALLGDLGVRHIRDDMPAGSAHFDRLDDLYTAHGIHTNWVPWAWGRTAPLPSSILNHLSQYSAISEIEGANEPENAKLMSGEAYTYGGHTDTADFPSPFVAGNYPATTHWQSDVYSAVTAASLPNLQVLAPAMASPGYIQRLLPMTAMDIATMHSYPQGEMPSAGRMFQLGSTQLPAVLAMAAGTKPVIVTETGYQSATNGGGTPVSEAAKAKYTPRLFAEYALRGISKTYAYQLLDERPDAGNSMSEQHFGWVDSSLEAKPVYTAMKNLIGLLSEATLNATTHNWDAPPFSPVALDYTTNGAPPSVHHLLLQKATGEWFLLLWNEVSCYQRATTPWSDTTNDPVPVTFTFNTPLAKAETLKLNSTTAISTTVNPVSLTVDVPDDILVIKLTPSKLPSPWIQTDVCIPNGITVAGDATTNDGVNFSEVKGAGIVTNGDGLTDNRHYVSQTIQGDVVIKAHVDSRSSIGTTPYAGLMIRDTLAPDSRQVSLSIAPDGKVLWQRRTNIGGFTNTTATAQALPSRLQWLKIERSGNTFKGFYSDTDGNWTQLGSDVTITGLGTEINAGLYVCSLHTDSLASAAFTDVAVDNSASPFVTLRATDAFASQNPGDTGTFVVTRTGPTTAGLTVNYTISGSATSGTHYTAPTGSVSIPIGQSEASFTVTPSTAANIQGDWSVVTTLTPSTTYKLGSLVSDKVTLRMGGNTLPATTTTDPAQKDNWYSPNTARSTVANDGNALRWTYNDGSDTPNSDLRWRNEIQLNFSAYQDWSRVSKVVIEFAEDVGNPDSDYFREIYYDYYNSWSKVSNNSGVGTWQLNKTTGYRTLELDLGQFPHNAVNRLLLYVDGDTLALGSHIWRIRNIRLEGATGQLP